MSLGIACSRQEMMLFLLGRVMFLILCIKIRKLSPVQFLMAQINGGRMEVDSICDEVRRLYKDRKYKNLQRLFCALVEGELSDIGGLGIAIDEINAHSSDSE